MLLKENKMECLRLVYRVLSDLRDASNHIAEASASYFTELGAALAASEDQIAWAQKLLELKDSVDLLLVVCNKDKIIHAALDKVRIFSIYDIQRLTKF